MTFCRVKHLEAMLPIAVRVVAAEMRAAEGAGKQRVNFDKGERVRPRYGSY